MCSWCWGFRPTWEKIRSSLPKEITVKYLLGGLAPDSEVPMPEAMQKDIAGYWRKIQQHIPGTEFNFDFWEKCQPRRSTYPACRAVIAARKQNPEIEQAMIEGIQKAYYLNAKNPSDNDTLIDIAEALGLDKNKFADDLDSQETRQTLLKEIAFSRSMGVQGFPSMILDKGGRYIAVPLDYNDPKGAISFIKEQNKD